jgi:hypothetical protein
MNKLSKADAAIAVPKTLFPFAAGVAVGGNDRRRQGMREEDGEKREDRSES